MFTVCQECPSPTISRVTKTPFFQLNKSGSEKTLVLSNSSLERLVIMIGFTSYSEFSMIYIHCNTFHNIQYTYVNILWCLLVTIQDIRVN